MIGNLISLLNALNHYGQSEIIEIAKGKHQIPTTIKKGWNQIKRNYKWQRTSR